MSAVEDIDFKTTITQQVVGYDIFCSDPTFVSKVINSGLEEIGYDIFCSDPTFVSKVINSGLEEKGLVIVRNKIIFCKNNNCHSL